MSKPAITSAVLAAWMCAARLAAADDTASEPPKSRGAAFALSAGGTALSLGIMAGGLATGDGTTFVVGALSSLITPSAGEWYAGQGFTLGLGTRLVSAGVFVAGVAEGFKCFSLYADNSSCHNDPQLAGALLIVGAVGYGAGVVYDIATAGAAADRYNQRFHLHVAPVVSRSVGAGTALGVGIQGTF